MSLKTHCPDVYGMPIQVLINNVSDGRLCLIRNLHKHVVLFQGDNKMQNQLEYVCLTEATYILMSGLFQQTDNRQLICLSSSSNCLLKLFSPLSGI